jgi:hypothetical protein
MGERDDVLVRRLLYSELLLVLVLACAAAAGCLLLVIVIVIGTAVAGRNSK